VELAGLDPKVAIACLLIVTIGSALQGVIGLGMGLLAAPLLAIADPGFLPLSTVVAVIPLGLGAAWRERHAVERRDVGIALLGRVVGVGFGAWATAATGHGFLALMIAASVLVAVVGSLTGWKFPTTDRNLLIAGAASGFTGTAAGVGGPPMGLTYQHAEPATLRATLSAFFAIGAVFSFAALAIAGEVDRHRLGLAAIVLPGVPLGLAISKPLIGRVPADRIRPLVLMVCAASAIALLLDELL
jgi:uncharacterized membrane protein YfcA